MHIYIRRIMLFFSYTAFVIIAPLVILYAVGYRPQISSPLPRPVGVILADADPKRARISVNGTLYGTLPRSVSNIEPGIATVEIQKEGYTPWTKQLEVKPTQATDIRSVRLLPSSFTTTPITENVSLAATSPTNALTAVVHTNNQLSILDEEGKTLFAPQQLPGKPSIISWSPDSSYILLTLPKNTYHLFRINGTTIAKVSIPGSEGLTDVIWSPIASNSFYALDGAKSVISYNILTQEKTVEVKQVNKYAIAGRTMYYQTFQNELALRQLRSGETTVLTNDTGKPLKKIAPLSSGKLALLFTDGELVLQESSGDISSVSVHANDMWWSPDEQMLLVQTAANELSIYNEENERLFAVPLHELQLITRLSRPITNPQWFSDSLHILYHTNNTLFFSEIDTRDHAISLPIDEIKNTSMVRIDKDSQSIFYVDETSSLVQTSLLTEQDQ